MLMVSNDNKTSSSLRDVLELAVQLNATFEIEKWHMKGWDLDMTHGSFDITIDYNVYDT